MNDDRVLILHSDMFEELIAIDPAHVNPEMDSVISISSGLVDIENRIIMYEASQRAAVLAITLLGASNTLLSDPDHIDSMALVLRRCIEPDAYLDYEYEKPQHTPASKRMRMPKTVYKQPFKTTMRSVNRNR